MSGIVWHLGLLAFGGGLFALTLVLMTGVRGGVSVGQTPPVVGQRDELIDAAGRESERTRRGSVEPRRPVVLAALAAASRRLTGQRALARLGSRLDQAGNPAALTVGAVMEYKGVCGLAGAMVGTLVCALGVPGGLGLVVGCVGLGFFCPNLLILHLAQQRQQRIQRTLPDIIDTLMVTVEAGLGFEAAIAHVVRSGRGPLPGEFARMLREMQLGMSRVQALRQVAARTTVAELRTFTFAMVQGTSLGVPLGGVLRQQAGQMRLRRRQRAEEQAQKVPVKIIFPTVLCVFPALFVVVLGPGAIRALGLLH